MDLQKLQEVQFETLKDIASVCDRHGIRYSMYCGTLLGAVRHKGFIPWDDDIDLAMPLRDYYRFMEVFPQEMQEKYDGLTYRTEKNGRCLWYRIYRKNTTYCPEDQLELEIDHRIYTDVYPMIGASDVQWKYRIQQFFTHLARVMIRADYIRLTKEKYTGIKRINYLTHVFPRSFREWFCGVVEKYAWIDPSRTKRMGTIDGVLFEGKFTRAQWEKMTKGEFHGMWFTMPEQYDSVLRMMYGDYIQLPPVEKRTTHMPGNTVFSTEKDSTVLCEERKRGLL
ncbi:MAG: LicD family protein [Solobacterium sp.]|nr:LicD family protein [Solobacterium sp.]